MPPKRKSSSKETDPKRMKAEDFIVKAKKIPKDPAAPKNPTSSYMYFATDARKRIIKKKPNLPFTELGREVGKEWQALNEKGRAQYETKAVNDKSRYEKEMAKYKPSESVLAELAKQKAAGLKLAKDPNKPKRGRTAYLVFCDLHREALVKKSKSMSFAEVSVKLAVMWKSVAAAMRTKCETTAAAEKATYEKALQSYKPGAEYQKALDMQAAARAKQSGKDPKAMAKKTKMKEVVQKQKDKVKTLRKEVAGIEKAIHTVNRMEEKLQGKKQQLAKFEKEILEKGGTMPDKEEKKSKKKKGKKKKSKKKKPSVPKAKPSIAKELSRKKNLVGKWVAVEFEGKAGKKGYRGHVISYDEKEDSHTVRWLDVDGEVDDDPDESSDEEVDALDPDEYELLNARDSKKADTEESKDKGKRKTAASKAKKGKKKK